MGNERKNPKEWTNPYSGFNDWKILCHFDHLKKVSDWYDGKGDLPPPIAVDTDPSNACTSNCTYCNSKDYRKSVGLSNMPKGHLLKFPKLYKDWGILSTCVAGGGESLCNPDTYEAIKGFYKYDIEVGMITNAVLLDENYADLLTDGARFCGISFDAATEKTHRLMRGDNKYKQIIKNIERLNRFKTKKKSSLDINIKFLIHPHNYAEMYDVAKMAKDFGCSGVHIRPVGLANVPGVEDITKKPGFNLKSYLEEVNELSEECYGLEDENFKVYTVKHKFSKKLGRLINFDKCRCTPVAGVFGADGWFHICFSRRGVYKLTKHYPDPYNVMRVWGSKKHRKIINKIKPKKCMRCAFARYNEVIEECVMKDNLFYKFL